MALPLSGSNPLPDFCDGLPMLVMDSTLVDLLRGAWPVEWRAGDVELLWTRLAASAEFRRKVEEECDLRAQAEAVLARVNRSWPVVARRSTRRGKKLLAVVVGLLLLLWGLNWFRAEEFEEPALDQDHVARSTSDPVPEAKKNAASEKTPVSDLKPAEKSLARTESEKEAATEETGEEAAVENAPAAPDNDPSPPQKQSETVVNEQPAAESPQGEQHATEQSEEQIARNESEANTDAIQDELDQLANEKGRRARLKRRRLEKGIVEIRRDHPLDLEPSREAETLWLELQTAIAEEHWEDVVRTLHAVSPGMLESVIEDLDDENLWVSYATLVDTLLAHQPALRELLKKELEPLGQLRLAAAKETQDAQRVAIVAWHFHGTDASAQAHLWLADRAMSTGDFAAARTHYERAQQYASVGTRLQLAARLRLAGAMLGTPLGSPLKLPVELAQTKFTTVDFEALILTQQLTHQRRYVSPPLVGAQAIPAGVPAMPESQNAFQLTSWIEYQDRAAARRGDKEIEIEELPSAELFSLAVGEITLLGNALFVSAVETRSGKVRWRRELTPRDERHGLRAIGPVMPAVADGRVYVRRWVREGTQLLALNVATGDVLWQTELTPDEPSRTLRGIMLTDPQVSGQRLSMFVATPETRLFTRGQARTEQIPWEIRLAEFSRANGELLTERKLATVTDLTHVPRASRVANIARYRILQIAGTVLCVDATGELAWVRKLPWEEMGQYDAAYRGPAVGNDEVVCVWQQGGTSLECLELASGRRRWEAPASQITRLVGCEANQLIAITNSGLQAFNLASGRTNWTRELPWHARHAVLCGLPGGLVFADLDPTPSGGWQARLNWVDVQTGETKQTAPLGSEFTAAKQNHRPLLGPLVPHGKGLLAGFDLGDQREMKRQLLWITLPE